MALIRARSRSATPEFQISKPAPPNHCQIASKFGKSGVFETGPCNLAWLLTDLNSGLGHYVEFGLFDKVSEWVDLECVLITGSRLRGKQ